MENKIVHCARTCKNFCTVLETASLREKEAILYYDALRDECTYPEIKVLLNELILRRQKSIQLLDEAKAKMKDKFDVLDQIRESFDMP